LGKDGEVVCAGEARERLSTLEIKIIGMFAKKNEPHGKDAGSLPCGKEGISQREAIYFSKNRVAISFDGGTW